MLALWEHAPSTVGALGAALGLDSATLTPLLKRLEAGGLVTRRRDAADERRVLVEPTAKGQALRWADEGGVLRACLQHAAGAWRAESPACDGEPFGRSVAERYRECGGSR